MVPFPSINYSYADRMRLNWMSVTFERMILVNSNQASQHHQIPVYGLSPPSFYKTHSVHDLSMDRCLLDWKLNTIPLVWSQITPWHFQIFIFFIKPFSNPTSQSHFNTTASNCSLPGSNRSNNVRVPNLTQSIYPLDLVVVGASVVGISKQRLLLFSDTFMYILGFSKRSSAYNNGK